ncbi:hypothetical protein ACFSQ3_08785 [Sphingobacterium corticis]|uniref:Uncharacterized protein n=1 Tax=Sphingobacterium corticis TaxID=1812823 RepID=A0ABW5NMK2_9SPHI
MNIIEEYLALHPVASRLSQADADLLRRTLSLSIYRQDDRALLNTSVLIGYCSEQLTNLNYPQPAIARIATKAAEILFKNELV